MARFAFKLQALLKHRRAIEDERQRALAQLLREKMIIESQLRRDQTTIIDDKRRMTAALAGHVDVPRIRQHAAHQHQVAFKAQQVAFKLLELTRRIDTARRDLTHAMKQRKAVEILRDKQWNRWRRQQNRRETAALDELATQRYARSTPEVAA
jgi:flagellar protein FliJ